MFQKFYEFNVSGIFYKMRENFPSMRVSVRMYQIACVSCRMRETWKVCMLILHIECDMASSVSEHFLNYCPLVWHLCSNRDIEKVGKIRKGL